jgi:hypothetical protein
VLLKRHEEGPINEARRLLHHASCQLGGSGRAGGIGRPFTDCRSTKKISIMFVGGIFHEYWCVWDSAR